MAKITRFQKKIKTYAHLFGIQTHYISAFNKRKVISDASIVAILKCMGKTVTNYAELMIAMDEYVANLFAEVIQPVTVAWEGKKTFFILNVLELIKTPVTIQLVHLESNEKIELIVDVHDFKVKEKNIFGKKYLEIAIPVKKQIPYGYYDVFIQFENKHVTCFLISAPYQSFDVQFEQNTFGLFSPIYALHSEQTYGCGDLLDFEKFTQLTKDLGGDLVGTLPFHAEYYEKPFEVSPYAPVSKLFWNELYLDLRKLPGFKEEMLTNGSPDAFFAIFASGEIKANGYIDYRIVYQKRREIINNILKNLQNDDAHLQNMEGYLRDNPDLNDYAKFRAVQEAQHSSWQLWNGNTDFAEDNLQFHIFVQYYMNEQLSQLKRNANKNRVNLYLDSPVGVHKYGYDTYRYRSQFIMTASTGAAPDPGFPAGQNWSIPPPHPIMMRKNKYDYFIKSLRAIMKYVNLLRIDHVMGLNQLYWIPDGLSVGEGAFVNYKSEELYAILCLESYRNQVVIIGENLGTVPNNVKHAIKEHQLHSMYITEYEFESSHTNYSSRSIPRRTIAALNTHDMYPFAAYIHSKDIIEKEKLKLINHETAQKELRKREIILDKLKSQFDIESKDEQELTATLLLQCLLILAKSQCEFLLLNLEDLWFDEVPQNIPNTNSEKNWCKKLKYSIAEISELPEVLQVAEAILTVRAPIQKSTAIKKMKTKLADAKIESAKAKSTIEKFSALPVSLLTKDDIYLFNEGTHYSLYNKLGAHVINEKDLNGTYFAVWAPNAREVYVLGDFNKWSRNSNPLISRGASGIWEGFVETAKEGQCYKYYIISNHFHERLEKTDPFGFYFEIPPNTASIIYQANYEWHDENWLKNRNERQSINAPISIYEVHLGSWRRNVEEGNRFLTYREIAPKLCEYVKNMGYTHVELLPIMEHPFYDSWGYQTTGYFAPTSRYGSPADFMFLIDYLHQHDIGVILDWVPSHFPTDAFALAKFDGTFLFEHADVRKGFHPDWKSAIFNYGRNEIRSFLISSACFWIDQFHVDAIRVDAVASMLYLDYSRKEGEWLANQYGGNENLEAIQFLRQLNSALYLQFPDIQTIAEESTAWSNVSYPTYVGGLGFGFKWDMGWMHDTLKYLSEDPIHRKYHHNIITFRMLYAFSEHYILALSHDEVVHGKRSLLDKMPGSIQDKFANVRLLYGYQFTLPGKKLLFMGDDFGQWQEWNNNESLDWHLMQHNDHINLNAWVKKLNEVYRSEPSLHEIDFQPAGFLWLNANDYIQSVLIFLRKDIGVKNVTICIFNGTPVARENYIFGVPYKGNLHILANSDDLTYGGSGILNETVFTTIDEPSHHFKYSLKLTLPPLSFLILKYIGSQTEPRP